jgi:uncharacterized protein YecT (DUF1311 family)
MNKVVKYGALGILLPATVLVVGGMVYFGFGQSAKEIGGDIASGAAPYVEAVQHADQAVKDSNELNRCMDKGFGASYCMEQQQMKKAMAPGGALNEALSNAQKLADSDARPEAVAVPESGQMAVSSVPVAVASAPSTQAPTTAGPSFDCSKAASAVEKLICSTPELSAADAEMASFYKKNIAASGDNSAAVKQGQRAFLSARNQCATVECVAEAYRARYEQLGQLGYVRE